jgi:hypothetical protein
MRAETPAWVTPSLNGPLVGRNFSEVKHSGVQARRLGGFAISRYHGFCVSFLKFLGFDKPKKT